MADWLIKYKSKKLMMRARAIHHHHHHLLLFLLPLLATTQTTLHLADLTPNQKIIFAPDRFSHIYWTNHLQTMSLAVFITLSYIAIIELQHRNYHQQCG
jgi:hypothetical protein